MKSMARRRLITSVALASTLVACTKERARKDKDRGGPVPVRVAAVESRLAPRLVSSIVTLTGIKQAEVYSRFAGRLSLRGTADGQPIKAGDVLFRIDRNDPGESFLSAPVVSPLSGWVGRWHVLNLGAQVTTADAVVTVVDDTILRAQADLLGEDWLAVEAVTQVTAVLNGKERAARVESVARTADPSTGRGAVSVLIDNPDRDWRAGLYAELRFGLTPVMRTLISASALILTDQGAFVFVAEGDNAKRVPIAYRLVDADTIEVEEGLSADARVIVAGGQLLGENSSIRVID